MLAVRFDGAVSVASVDVPVPEVGETRVLVRMAGICSTDLEITRGYAAFRGTLGHEFVGEVAPDADPAWAGRRVVAEINAACGACDRCAAGLGRHCAARRVIEAPLLAVLHSRLRAGGELHFASDIYEVALEAMAEVDGDPHSGFVNLVGPWRFARDNPYGARSKREAKTLGRGDRVWRLRWRRVDDAPG